MKCPVCGSEHVIKYGYKMTVSQGKKQRLQCQDCGHSFYVKIGEVKEVKSNA